MTEITDLAALRRAMAENAERPEGPARNARAEQLLSAAEGLNVPLAVIEALGHQLSVYNYSSEKDKMFVPFARLLRLWDERPGDFDAYETHSLHWVFKWMSAGMLDQPHIPLASIEKWLGEMEHRYRLAGHSERAVRGAEFSVAAHIGDLARAERAYAAWLAADRDEMADCHACELYGQGLWQVERGRDAAALTAWRPVLEGEFSCAHEPHSVLAASLVPLLRLGRTEEARAHHLRGLRLVRPMESMRTAYAEHVEFCALTGNEARGLELLAERPAYFTDTGHPRSRLDFLAVVTLLTGRLTELGLGGERVPGPGGRAWTARDLAAHARTEALALAERFDARNGTPYVGDRTRARMAGRPLVNRLPLGVRAPRVVPAAPAVAAPPPAPAAETSLPDLVAEARRLADTLRPEAMDAWAAVARAAGDGGLAPADRASAVDHEAMSRGPEGAELFERAAELYAAAGDPGEALAARARGAYFRALRGEPDAALARVTGLAEEVRALYAAEATGVRQTASVLMSRARILMHRARTGAGPVTDADAAVREVPALIEGHGTRGEGEVRLTARVAESWGMLAELAGAAGDGAGAADLLRRASATYVRAGLPWCAVEYEVQVAALAEEAGDREEAERALRAALEHGGPYVEPAGQVQLHLRIADLTAARDDVAAAVEHALRATHRADEAGESGTSGAWARQRLGGYLLRQGRCAEAAEVLESALADLRAGTHGDEAVVQARWWLGDCLEELGEHRAAAEQRLLAADIARHWPEQRDHATLAHLAADSLGSAGLAAEADRAYARAGELWRSLGDTRLLVRSLRARAWLALREDSGTAAAEGLMAEAVDVCERTRESAADSRARADLTRELAQTERQFGDLLAQAGGAGAAARFERAITLFGSLGVAGLHDRTAAELTAAGLAAELGRPEEAAARAHAVLAAYENADETDETVRSRRAEATRVLTRAE
ncbi:MULTISPECIES: tetratricopeptide repeat protein [unclassified Streptomyces]|uniref:tetratricopeptide repeat protein n=1 Tax=unclassified Streptomyces TaxID=2593676 RepID=UPI003332BB5B